MAPHGWYSKEMEDREKQVKTNVNKDSRAKTRPSILHLKGALHAFYGTLHQEIFTWLELNFKQWKIIRTYNKNPLNKSM